MSTLSDEIIDHSNNLREKEILVYQNRNHPSSVTSEAKTTTMRVTFC